MYQLNVDYRFVNNSGVEKEQVEATLLLNNEVIGIAEMYLIEGGECLAGYMDQADEYSHWVPMDAMYSIDFDGVTGIKEKIGYIHHVLIYEEHRGKKYASYFLRELEQIARLNGMKTMILQACSTERNRTDLYFSDSEKLKDFYERNGYQIYETETFMRNPYHYKTLV